LDRRFQFRRDAFVGVKTEDPVVTSLIYCELFLRGEAGPGIHDYSRTALSSELTGRISRFRINHQNLVGPGDGLARLTDVFGFVESDDCRRDSHSRFLILDLRLQTLC